MSGLQTRATELVRSWGTPCTCGWNNGHHEGRCEKVSAWDRAMEQARDEAREYEEATDAIEALDKALAHLTAAQKELPQSGAHHLDRARSALTEAIFQARAERQAWCGRKIT